MHMARETSTTVLFVRPVEKQWQLAYKEIEKSKSDVQGMKDRYEGKSLLFYFLLILGRS